MRANFYSEPDPSTDFLFMLHHFADLTTSCDSAVISEQRVSSRLSPQRAMIFTLLLATAAAVDMHQKVTPVQKVPATENSYASVD